MKKRYLIAIDMDQTLLTDDKKISKETMDYLKYLEDDGNVIVIASGRPLRAIKPYYEAMKLHGPIVCYNGAYVVDPYNNIVKEHNVEIDRNIIKNIITDVGEENFLNIMCETNDEAWVIKDDPRFESFFWKEGIEVHEGSILETLDKDPFTTIILTPNHDHDEKLVKAAFAFPGMGLRFWDDSCYSELYFLNTNKGSAVLNIADAYGIDYKNIIAIGDGENDEELIRNAGIGVAMKNSCELLLSHADMVSLDDNNNDGVKKTLEYLLVTNH